MHILTRILLVAALTAVAFAPVGLGQGPFVYYPDDNTAPNAATPGGWFPWFTNATGVRYQIRVPASAFASLPGQVLLTSAGFVFGATNTGANATYSQGLIRIGPSAVTTLTNTFDTNLLPGTETQVADFSGQTYVPQATTGVWIDVPFQVPYAYNGGDLIIDFLTRIPSGGAYLRTAVSSLVPRLTNTAYAGQPTGTLNTASGVKIRFGYQQAGTIDFQVNTAYASLLVNNVTGTFITPAAVNLAVGQTANATIASNQLVGLPWDIALGFAPLVPATAGGFSTANGEAVNIDLSDPTLFFFWNIFQSPGFQPLVIPYPTNGPSTISTQMFILDPGAVSGFRCSQPSRVIVQ